MLAVVVVLLDEGLLSNQSRLHLLVLAVQDGCCLELGVLHLQDFLMLDYLGIKLLDNGCHLVHVGFGLVVISLVLLELEFHSLELLS